VSSIVLVRAPNPSPMTLTGTNSYVIDAGNGEAIVIDPGPAIERHVEALVANARERGLRITTVAVTHGHPDHAPAAEPLRARTGATVWVHPNSDVPHDRTFEVEGELRVGNRGLRVIDAPGHTFEHVALYEPSERALFTGDVILGQGTVVIAPPGGAMRPYQRTLERLRNEFDDAARIYGGHGPVVEDPRAKIEEYIEHRKTREAELLHALRSGPMTIPQLVTTIYATTPPVLWPAAARQMLAYLIALSEEGTVVARALDRPMTEKENTILNPAWESIVGAEHAPVIRAELGAMLKLDTLYEYSLLGNR
jgi:glyoxylase-like metal-dependent hydrolase (beta-lactamase superfamily II)